MGVEGDLTINQQAYCGVEPQPIKLDFIIYLSELRENNFYHHHYITSSSHDAVMHHIIIQ